MMRIGRSFGRAEQQSGRSFEYYSAYPFAKRGKGISTCDMCCGLVAVDVMCTTEALGILKLCSPASGTVVT